MKQANKLFTGIIAEVAFYFFLYYAQYLLGVVANLWISSLILLVLANAALAFCPVLGEKCK